MSCAAQPSRGPRRRPGVTTLELLKDISRSDRHGHPHWCRIAPGATRQGGGGCQESTDSTGVSDVTRFLPDDTNRSCQSTPEIHKFISTPSLPLSKRLFRAPHQTPLLSSRPPHLSASHNPRPSSPPHPITAHIAFQTRLRRCG